MRRSAAVRLTLLSAASVALLACGEDGPPEGETLFTNEAACREAFRNAADEECREAFRIAEANHLATAPRFPDTARCEAETGGPCEVVGRPGLASYAIPVMAGVLLGRAASAGGPRNVLPVYGGRPPAQCTPQPGGPPPPGPPECPRTGGTTSRSYFFGGNYVGSTDAQGRTRAFTPSARGSQALAPRPSTGTTARGGVGATGRSFSGGAT